MTFPYLQLDSGKLSGILGYVSFTPSGAIGLDSELSWFTVRNLDNDAWVFDISDFMAN